MAHEWKDDENASVPEDLEQIIRELPSRPRIAATACLRPQVRTDGKPGRRNLCLGSIAAEYKADLTSIKKAERAQGIGRTPGHVLGEFLEHAEALLKILARADRQEFPGLSLKHHFDTAGKLEMVRSWIEQADGLRASERTPGRKHALDGRTKSTEGLEPDRWLFRKLFDLLNQRDLSLQFARVIAEGIRAWAVGKGRDAFLAEPGGFKWGERALAEVRKEWGVKGPKTQTLPKAPQTPP